MPRLQDSITGRFTKRAPTHRTHTPLVCPSCGELLELLSYIASGRPIALDCVGCDYSFSIVRHRASADQARAEYLANAKPPKPQRKRGMIRPSS